MSWPTTITIRKILPNSCVVWAELDGTLHLCSFEFLSEALRH